MTIEYRVGNAVMLYDKNKGYLFKMLKPEDFNKRNFDKLYKYEPITLTAKWLRYLGFQDGEWDLHMVAGSYTIYVDYFNDNIIRIDHHKNGGGSLFLEPIKYLHQLQNLYTLLTGGQIILDGYDV